PDVRGRQDDRQGITSSRTVLMSSNGARVLVTGAGGFIGSALARTLCAQGYRVVAMLEPGADSRGLADLDVECLTGDVRDPQRVRVAVQGCYAVFHVAALYRFWTRRPQDFYDVNVGGTRNVLTAAEHAGVERVVYTSTVGTLGLDPGPGERPADEQDYPDVGHLFGAYKRSKYVAEHEVLRAGAQGQRISLVLPTFPLGPGDRSPTPSGRLILDFLNGRIPGYVDTVLNVAHVDDVAQGHLLALERGAPGRSYILGGENVTLKQLLDELAAQTGLPSPRLHVPRSASLAAAWVSEVVEGRMLRRRPSIPLEGARMSTTRMAFDDSRARTELGYAPRPFAEAVQASAQWFVDNGYVRDRRRAKIGWSPHP
ncbi:MAG: SDR family oxidoreductase, partial [Actinomycetota bacterium]|nr:SDR family oxidoreductase [Actinomycetota bacterium]